MLFRSIKTTSPSISFMEGYYAWSTHYSHIKTHPIQEIPVSRGLRSIVQLADLSQEMVHYAKSLRSALLRVPRGNCNPFIVAKKLDIANVIGCWSVSMTVIKRSRTLFHKEFRQISDDTSHPVKDSINIADIDSALLNRSILVNELLILVYELQTNQNLTDESSLSQMADIFREKDDQSLSRAFDSLLPLIENLGLSTLQIMAEALSLALKECHSPGKLSVIERMLSKVIIRMHDESVDISKLTLDLALAKLDLKCRILDCNSPSASNNCLGIWAESIASKRRMQRCWTQELEAESLRWANAIKYLLDAEVVSVATGRNE